MPYTIQTKDGIRLQNIPDELDPNGPEVRARVAQARASRPAPVQPNRAMLDMSPVAARPQQEATPAQTTLTGLIGAVDRGAAPYAAGAALGAAAGAPLAGVGAIPGALAGMGAVGLAKLVGDPIVSAVNGLLGTKYATPTEAMDDLLTRMGVPEPRTEAERIVRTASEAAGGASGQISLGSTLARQGFSAATQGVGRALASNPGAQLAGAATGGAASQITAEAGGGPVAQLAAGVIGAGVGGALATKRPKIVKPSPAAAAEVAAPEAVAAVEGAAPRPVEIPAPAPVVPTEIPQADLAKVIKKASGTGIGAAASREELASMAAINPQAAEAAKRLGIELPADVFSDNPQIRAAVGLTRSQAGTEAESAWRTTVSNAVQKADEVIAGLGTTYEEGMPSPGVVSEKVLGTLKKTRESLNEQATQIYKEVDDTIPKSTPVKLGKVEELLVQLLDEVGEGGLSTQEKRLLKMVDSPDGITYGRLIREKNLMGQAIAGKDSPYGNMEAGALKRLYAALAEDQLANVGAASEGLGEKLKGANLIYAQERKLGKLIVGAFGDNQQGSIAGQMRAAITDSAKGGSAAFNNLLELVPQEHQREAIATALASATRSMRGAEAGGAGFSEFAKLYPQLRANAPVYAKIVKILGPEAHETLRDFYEVSRRITDARANVLTTGKANQGLLNELRAEGLAAKVLNASLGRGLVAGASAVGGGPAAAGAVTALMNALSNGKKDAVKAAGELFASPEFQRLMLEATTKPPSASAVRALAGSGKFQRFAALAHLPSEPEQRQNWILNAMRAETATQETR